MISDVDSPAAKDEASPHPSPILVLHLIFPLIGIGLPVSAVRGVPGQVRGRISAVFPDAIPHFGAPDVRFCAFGTRGVGGVRERHRMEADVRFGNGFVRAAPAPAPPVRVPPEGS